MSEYRTVAELLAVPERWTQRSSARDARGVCVNADSKAAVKWCLLGGIRKVYPKWRQQRMAITRLDSVQKSMHPRQPDFLTWQDAKRRRHAEVLAVVQKAGI